MVRAVRSLGLACLLAAGCFHHVRDISAVAPYSGYVGATYRLHARAELLDRDSVRPGHSILFARAEGASDAEVLAHLPAGYEIRVEAVRREERTLRMGGFHVTDEYAVVSLADPTGRNGRVRATVSVEELVKMPLAVQAAPPRAGTPADGSPDQPSPHPR
jgi:hypothetical protein